MSKLDEPAPPALPDSIALQIIARAPFSLLISDPKQPDNPVVYVNEAFEHTTGFKRAEVLGRNCRFLQGQGTDPRTTGKIRAAIDEGREIMLDILNYRADGTPFWNRLMIAPLYDAKGQLQHFIGVQKVLGERLTPTEEAETDTALREIQHRVKNHLAMIVSMIRLQSRGLPVTSPFDTLARRVEGLQLLYEELSHRGGENRNAVALGAYLSRIVNAIAHLDGRGGVRVNVDVEAFVVPMETAVHLGLIVSEVLTNALQHAFAGRDEGLLATRVHEIEGGAIRVQISDNGIGLPEGVAWPDGSGLGGRIVAQLTRALDASLNVSSGAAGTVVTIDVPRTARERF